MIEHAHISAFGDDVDLALSRALERGDSDLEKISPVLGHLLGNADHALFSDEVVARVRGMLADLARQLRLAEALAGDSDAQSSSNIEPENELTRLLTGIPELLTHCHALSLEWQLSLRLEAERSLDPVVSPLVQALIASDEPATSSLGMTSLSSFARFSQAQRRMELPIQELPAELFHAVMVNWRRSATPTQAARVGAAEEQLRAGYDESANRLGLLGRLVSAIGKGVSAALTLEHAGVAMFLSALASTTGQKRESIVVAMNERQAARLLLALRSSGLKPQLVDEQMLFLHASALLPSGSSQIDPDSAAALLEQGWDSGSLSA